MVVTPEFEILSKYFYIFVPDRPLRSVHFRFTCRQISPCRTLFPLKRARCPIFRTTCPEIPAESVPVSHFQHHLAKGGGGFGGELEQREANMRRAVKMRKARGKIDSDAGK